MIHLIECFVITLLLCALIERSLWVLSYLNWNGFVSRLVLKIVVIDVIIVDYICHILRRLMESLC